MINKDRIEIQYGVVVNNQILSLTKSAHDIIANTFWGSFHEE